MTRIRLAYIHRFRDRHGKARHYVRRTGFKPVPLPGQPGTEEFMAAYAAAMNGETAVRLEVGASRTAAGTVNAAIASYYSSAAFLALATETQGNRRAILERFREEHGDKRIAMLEQRHLMAMLAVKKPHAAKNWLKALRGLLQHAVAAHLRPDNPTAGIKLARRKRSDGFPTWTQEHIAAFRACHVLGTRARLALELLAGTGQRRGDVVRMGRQHVREGVLSIRQSKTGNLVEIPIHKLPELVEAIAAMPAGDHLTYLTTDSGKPFTAAGFGNWFRDRCKEAGLPTGYVAHGLRKASATRQADAGGTEHELMAWHGWTSISEAERYTKAADRRRLAQSVVAKLKPGTSTGKPS
jgi:integrase